MLLPSDAAVGTGGIKTPCPKACACVLALAHTLSAAVAGWQSMASILLLCLCCAQQQTCDSPQALIVTERRPTVVMLLGQAAESGARTSPLLEIEYAPPEQYLPLGLRAHREERVCSGACVHWVWMEAGKGTGDCCCLSVTAVQLLLL